MAKKQTRRSISVNRDVYQRLSDYAETTKLSRSSIVEKLINKELDKYMSAQATN